MKAQVDRSAEVTSISDQGNRVSSYRKKPPEPCRPLPPAVRFLMSVDGVRHTTLGGTVGTAAGPGSTHGSGSAQGPPGRGQGLALCW